MMGLRELREAAGLNQTELARLVGTSQPQINRLEQGDRQITKKWALRLAPHLRVTPEFLLFGDQKTAPVVGYVGAGAEAHYYADGQGPFDEVPAPEGATDKTVAVEIRGESLGALFDRWLVFYDDVRSPVTPDLIGKLCVVGLADGRVLIKKLRRSKTEGLFHLISNVDPPILDEQVDWAAKVKTMVPR